MGLDESNSVPELRDHHERALRAICVLVGTWHVGAAVAIWDAENDVRVVTHGALTERLSSSLLGSLMDTLEAHRPAATRATFAREVQGYAAAGTNLRFRGARRGGGLVIVAAPGGAVIDAAGHALLQLFAKAIEGQCELYDAAVRLRSMPFELLESLMLNNGGLPKAILDGTLARSLPAGAVLVYDRELTYVFANGQALRWLGKTREAVEGATLAEVVSAENLARLETVYRAALAGHTDLTEVHRDGRFYQAITMPITSSRGEIVAGAVLVQDVTDARTLEGRLRLSAESIAADA